MPLSRNQLRQNSKLHYNILHYAKDYDKSLIELLHAHFSDRKASALLEDCKVRSAAKEDAYNSDLYQLVKESKRRFFVNAQDLYHTIQRRYPSSANTLKFCTDYNRCHLKKHHVNREGFDRLADMWQDQGGCKIDFLGKIIDHVLVRLALINQHEDKEAIVSRINIQTTYVELDCERVGKEYMTGLARFLLFLTASLNTAVELCIGVEAGHEFQLQCQEYFKLIPRDNVELRGMLKGSHLLYSFHVHIASSVSASDTPCSSVLDI